MTRTPPAAGSRYLGVPSPSSGQSRGFLAILAVLLLAAGAPAQEPARLFPARAAARGGPGGYVSAGPLFYDTEGRAGVYRPDHLLYEAFTFSTTESGDQFWSYFGGEGFVPGLTPGEAFFWEHTSLVPGYESIVGVGVVDSYYWGGGPRPIYPIFPVPASLTGTGLEEDSYSQPTGAGILIYAFFGDSRVNPTVCTRIEAAPSITSRRMRVTAEYLEGNAIFGAPPETKDWQNPVTFPPDVAANPLWGSAFSTSPEVANFSRTLPVGPIRMTLGMDGFTSGHLEKSLPRPFSAPILAN